jgi:hypothetical protein
MTTYTNTQLKQALAKMLPEVLFLDHRKYYKGHTVSREEDVLCWSKRHDCDDVLDTELLHLCWLVEETLDEKKLHYSYAHEIYNVVVPPGQQPFRATWQQRTIALAKVKEIEIV